MKILNLIIIASLLSVSFISCDKVEAPYKEEIIIPDDTTATYQKNVLLEDFTGHKCVNCPAAHETGHDLTEIYGDDRLIIVAIHSGFYASPASAPYDYDFRTDAGTEYASAFGVQGYPMGIIDRVNDGGNYLLDVNKWGTVVNQQIGEELQIGLTITSSTNGDKISGEVAIEFLTDVNSATKLQLWILEDNIIKAQLTPEGDEEDYVHNHVLRGDINGVWGESLPKNSYAAQEIESMSFTGFQIGDDWVMDELSIVAFVYDADSKKVIQIQKKKLIE